MSAPGVFEADLAATAHAADNEKEGTHSKDRNDHYVTEESHDGLDSDEPTALEKETLTRVPGHVDIKTFSIGIIELAERFSFYGTTVVFTNYIQRPLPPGSTTGRIFNNTQRPGALGFGQRGSTGLTTLNNLLSYTTPLLGGFIADNYLGRFKTICWSVLVALVGHTLLVISAIPAVIASPNGSIAVFCIAMLIMALGTGGFKANISPLIAEQSTHSKLQIKVLKSGRKVIEDPAMTAARIFMWFYMLINIGALVGQIGMAYAEKDVGFWLSYLLPTMVFLFIAPPILLYGRNRYVQTPPTGSVLATAIRVMRMAGKGKWLKPKQLTAEGVWDAAKPSKIPVDQRPSFMTWDDAFVDEVRRGLKACKVFAWYPLWWLTYNQCNNNLVSQAATLDTHGIPNDVISNLDPFAVIILIPVCDLLVYPALRRAGIKFGPIKRIAAGFLTGTLAMIWAAVVQAHIYKTSPCGDHPNTCDLVPAYSPSNVWIQTGSYVLIALSEIFASITGLEYAFTKAPKSMKSLVTGVFLFTSALSYALGEAFVSLSDDPLLIWNYTVAGILSFVGFVGFWFSFRHLDKEDEALNDLVEGSVGTKPIAEKELESPNHADSKA